VRHDDLPPVAEREVARLGQLLQASSYRRSVGAELNREFGWFRCPPGLGERAVDG